VDARGLHVNQSAVQKYARRCKTVRKKFCEICRDMIKHFKNFLWSPGAAMKNNSLKLFANNFSGTVLALLAGALGCGYAPVARGQAAAPTSAVAHEKNYSQAEQHAQAVAKSLLSRGIPGLSVAVAVDERIVYSEGFGLCRPGRTSATVGNHEISNRERLQTADGGGTGAIGGTRKDRPGCACAEICAELSG
jgi:hypothetical protein